MRFGNSLNTSLKSQEYHSTRLLSYLDRLETTSPNADQALSSEENDKQVEGSRSASSDTSVKPQDIVSLSIRHDNTSDLQLSGFQARFDCRRGCGCSCHIKNNITSPRLLNYLLGEVSIRWGSQKKMEVRCKCSTYMDLAISYQFPPYMLQRYISMILGMTRLDCPELLLRVPRVLPWTHLLWRYSNYGDLKGVQRMFTDREASPYDIDPVGRNALVYASMHRSTEMAMFLLDQGADVTQPDILGSPASERLLKRSFGKMYSDNSTIIRRILKGDDCFDEFGFTTLHKIVLGFDFRELQVVLDATTDTLKTPDIQGRTCLFWAVFRDSFEHVRILLSYDADPNIKDLGGRSPLDYVRGPAVCQLLLDHGAKMNVNSRCYGRSSLHEHVLESGCPEVIDVFATAGFDIDIKNNDDETPLLNAIYRGQTTVTKRLIELGANINGANKSSRDSAIHFAAHGDRPDILKMLLEHGADYTALECYGRNLAHCAARTGSTEFLKVMTAAQMKDLNVDLKDQEGKTPGEYIESRIVITDREVGVHEAWEVFVSSLRSPQFDTRMEGTATVKIQTLKNPEKHELCEGRWRIPGAFPITTRTLEKRGNICEEHID